MKLPSVDSIVKNELRMDIINADENSRIKNLFVDNHTLLRRNRLSWLLETNEAVAIQHVLREIRPAKLRQRLESDIGFRQYCLRKDFSGFFKHGNNVSDAFPLIDGGSLREERKKYW